MSRLNLSLRTANALRAEFGLDESEPIDPARVEPLSWVELLRIPQIGHGACAELLLWMQSNGLWADRKSPRDEYREQRDASRQIRLAAAELVQRQRRERNASWCIEYLTRIGYRVEKP